MLPAAHGDALWIEYGSGSALRRVSIDCGPAHTYEPGMRKFLAGLPKAERRVELFVVTHIDADHIDGSLILLQERQALDFKPGELWFNGWDQLQASERDAFAPLQGEFLTSLMEMDPDLKVRWNKSFDGKAVFVPDGGALPTVRLAGGARITLLGPGPEELKRLRARWSSAIRDFSPGDAAEARRRLLERREYVPPAAPAVFSGKSPGSDHTPANGSSISFLLEVGDASILLAGDAHARTLERNLKRLCDERSLARLPVSAVKLPHHGSVANVSVGWLKLVQTRDWLVSTSGAVFAHPDIEMAQLVALHSPVKPCFHFNYDSRTTQLLDHNSSWDVVYPTGDAGLLVELTAQGAVRPSNSRSAAKTARRPGNAGRSSGGTVSR